LIFQVTSLKVYVNPSLHHKTHKAMHIHDPVSYINTVLTFDLAALLTIKTHNLTKHILDALTDDKLTASSLCHLRYVAISSKKTIRLQCRQWIRQKNNTDLPDEIRGWSGRPAPAPHFQQCFLDSQRVCDQSNPAVYANGNYPPDCL
jgi:hypothetical protein